VNELVTELLKKRKLRAQNMLKNRGLKTVEANNNHNSLVPYLNL
jgi:hypothetical protein